MDTRGFHQPPELWAGAQDHGVCLGWTQPFHDEHGRFSSLSVVRQHPPVTVNELYRKGAAVLWLVQVLHATAAALVNDPQGPSSSE
nr:autoinducer binding domain-containing protein [uncultured Pseudomonas sp.]